MSNFYGQSEKVVVIANFDYQGVYDTTRTYTPGQAVGYAGDLFVAIVNVPANTATSDTNYWVSALRGERGPIGYPPLLQFSDNGTDFYNPPATGSVVGYRYSTDNGVSFSTFIRTQGPQGERGTDGRDGLPGPAGTNQPQILIQYADRPNSDDFKYQQTQTSRYIRFSVDGGSSWGHAWQAIGKDGRDGLDLEAEYSVNGIDNWHSAEAHTDNYVRTRIGDEDPFGPVRQIRGFAEGGSGSYKYIDSVSEVPNTPEAGYIVKVTTAIASGLTNFKAADGTTDKTSAAVGDGFEYNGTQWILKETRDPRTGAFTSADENKLDGIEDGAQVNPDNVVKVSLIDSDLTNLAAGVIGWSKDGSQLTEGTDNITDSDQIDISVTGATFGQDPSSPDVSLTAVNLRSYFNNRLNKGGYVFLAFQLRGATDFVYCQAETITARIGGWTLTNLTWHGTRSLSAAGSKWNIVCGSGVEFTKDIVDFIDGIEAAFHPKPSDYWIIAGDDFSHWASQDVTGSVSFFTGAPSASTIISIASVFDWSTITRVRISATAWDNTNYFQDPTDTIPTPTVGLTMILHSDVPYVKSSYAEMSITAVTTTGTGDAKYYELTVTTVQTGANFSPGNNLLLRVTDKPPIDVTVPGSQLEINEAFIARIHALENYPVSLFAQITSKLAASPLASYVLIFLTALQNALFGLTSFIDGLRNRLQPPAEHRTLTSWRWRGEPDPNNLTPLTVPNDKDVGQINPTQIWFNADIASVVVLEAYLKMDHLIRIEKDASNYIEYIISSTSFGKSEDDYYVNFDATKKTAVGTIAINDTVSVILTGPFVGWENVKDAVGDVGSNLKVVSEAGIRAALDAGLKLEDIVSLSGAKLAEVTRDFVNVALQSGVDGEALISSDNTAPNEAPGATSILAVDKTDASSNDESNDLEKANVGDIFVAELSNKYIIATIKFIKISQDTNYYEFYFNPSTDEEDTYQYESIGTGAGKIRFYKQAVNINDLDELTDPADDDALLVWDKSANEDKQIQVSNLRHGTKNGVHRRVVTELSGTTGSTAPGLSLITAAYTPQNTNARIYVRLRIVASCVGNSDNDYSQVAVRVKRGSNNYKRIDEGADGFTTIAGERMWQYSDNTTRAHYEEFELEPQDNKDEIKVNLSIYMKDAASVASTEGRLNRWGINRNVGPSFIEVYELMPKGTLTRTTITTLDSA